MKNIHIYKTDSLIALLFMLIMVTVSRSQTQTLLSGWYTGRNGDTFLINDDYSSEPHVGVRFLTQTLGVENNDWKIYFDLNLKSLYIDSDYGGGGAEEFTDRRHLVINSNYSTIYDFLAVGKDVNDYNGVSTIYGATHIYPEGETPTPFNSETYDNYLLRVEGKVLSTNLALTNVEDWADYVFEKDYPLKNLKELEEYIKKNGHLPNIPSEKEVLKNGYSVHKMNKLFIEKIEELTLYSIEQNKKINALLKELGIEEDMIN